MDDDELWGPPLVVQDDTPRKPLRGCEFWFDCRTDVLEENFQNGRYCELVWRILNEKKQDAEIDELHKDVASSGSGVSRDIGSPDSDKTLSAILPPDGDTSSAKSALDEDENTSSISDAQTVETKDSSNDTQVIDPDTELKPQETAANDPITVEVVEDAYTSCIPVLASKIEEAEEHSCSSLVTDQVFDPIKQASENKSPSAISREDVEGSTLRPLDLETREKVREKSNATNEDGDTLKDQQQQQSNSLRDIETALEPFTTESLLEMCDAPEKVDKKTPCDGRSKKSLLEAVKTAAKDEPIINLLTEARQNAESKALLTPGSNGLLKPGTVLLKKRQSNSNPNDDKCMDTSLIRNTKQKVGADVDPVKNSNQSTPKIVRGPAVPTQLPDSTLDLIERIRQRGGQKMGEPVTSISELKSKTGKELRSIAKEAKMTHYYKLKKEDLLQQLIRHLNLPLTDCTKPIMES